MKVPGVVVLLLARAAAYGHGAQFYEKANSAPPIDVPKLQKVPVMGVKPKPEDQQNASVSPPAAAPADNAQMRKEYDEVVEWECKEHGAKSSECKNMRASQKWLTDMEEAIAKDIADPKNPLNATPQLRPLHHLL